MMQKYVDVLITNGTEIGGSYKYEGNIYQLTEEEARRVETEGKGQIAEVKALEVHKNTLKTIADQLSSKLKAVHQDPRLSDFAKKQDKEELIKESEVIAQSVQEKYESELQTLNKAAQDRFRNSIPETTLSPDEIKTRTRLIISETMLSSSFEAAINVLKDQIEHAEPSVLRELQSRFYEIKTELDSRISENDNMYDRISRSGELTKVFDSLKEKSLTPEQTELKKRADLYKALSQQRGDVRSDFLRTTQMMKRQL